jgi:hypothetical protein
MHSAASNALALQATQWRHKCRIGDKSIACDRAIQKEWSYTNFEYI